MTHEDRKKAEARIAEIGQQIEALRRERIELRGRLVHATSEWLNAQARLAAAQSREERGAAAVRSRAARRAHRDPNPPCPSLPRGDRDEDPEEAA